MTENDGLGLANAQDLYVLMIRNIMNIFWCSGKDLWDFSGSELDVFRFGPFEAVESGHFCIRKSSVRKCDYKEKKQSLGLQLFNPKKVPKYKF